MPYRRTLTDYLPRTNDPGCAAGFAHGVVTAIAPDPLRAGPVAAATVCAGAATRYRRYSCTHGLGHAHMRFHDESLRPSLRRCRALGPNAAPGCAQGVYHDYWLATTGADEAKRPRGAPSTAGQPCERQPRPFVLPCWYRALIDTRPAGYRTESPEDLLRICHGTRGLQRRGCVTAASVIGSPTPLRQMGVWAQTPRRDMLACIHGVKVQNLIGTPAVNELRAIRRCDWFEGAIATGCHEWLGKVLTVTTDGRFRRTGCPRGSPAARVRARSTSFNGHLVTFS